MGGICMLKVVSRKEALGMIDNIFIAFHHGLMQVNVSGIETSWDREYFMKEAQKIDQGHLSKEYEQTVNSLDAAGFKEYYKYIGKFASTYKIGNWEKYNQYESILIENLNEELGKYEQTEDKLDLIDSFTAEELQSESFMFESKVQLLYDILDDFRVGDNKEKEINKVLASFNSGDKAAFISKLQNDNTILNNLINKIDGAEQREMASLIGEMFISSGFLTDQKVTLLDNKQEEKINASFKKGKINIKYGKKEIKAEPFDIIGMNYAGSVINVPALMLLANQEKNLWETLWGALQGEFNEDQTGKEILVDMGLNFIPGVGQLCDIRDIAACIKKLTVDNRVNEVMIWITLLLTAIGCIPYAGDVIKAGCKAVLKGADDVILVIFRKLDAEDVYKAFKLFKATFIKSIDDAIAMVFKWLEKAGNSKYGKKITKVLAEANDKLHKAADFVKSRIDDLEERLFKKEKDVTQNCIENIGNEVQKNIVEEVKKNPKILENLDHPHNYTKHGNFGEIAVDVDLEGTGHIKRISMHRVDSLDTPMHKGIDGIYENLTPPPKYIIVDSKYLSSEVSKADTFAPTMSNTKESGKQLGNPWIEKNLEAEFKDESGKITKENQDKLDEILTAIAIDDDSMCLRLGGKVDSTGKITYYKYDSDGFVIKEETIMNGKKKEVPVIWEKGE